MIFLFSPSLGFQIYFETRVDLVKNYISLIVIDYINSFGFLNKDKNFHNFVNNHTILNFK